MIDYEAIEKKFIQMKNYKTFIKSITLALLFTATILQDSTAQTSANPGQAQNPSFFTGGTAQVERIATPPELNCGAAKVTFQPKTRTIWHSHAGGQFIVVTQGTAWYQEKGKPKKIIPQGGVAICPPNVMHWHGASPDGVMSHTVATPNIDKGGATAGEAVTDKEYYSTN